MGLLNDLVSNVKTQADAFIKNPLSGGIPTAKKGELQTSIQIPSSSSLLKVGSSVLSGLKSIAVKAIENPKTAATIALGAPVAIGALTTAPKQTLSAPFQLVSSLTNVGKNLGEVAKNPSIDAAINVFKQNPFTAGALALVSTAVVGKGVPSLISSFANTRAINESTKATKELLKDSFSDLPSNFDQAKDTTSILPSGNSSAIPSVTPAMGSAVVPSTASPRKSVSRRRSRKPQNLNISIRNMNYGNFRSSI